MDSVVAARISKIYLIYETESPVYDPMFPRKACDTRSLPAGWTGERAAPQAFRKPHGILTMTAS